MFKGKTAVFYFLSDSPGKIEEREHLFIFAHLTKIQGELLPSLSIWHHELTFYILVLSAETTGQYEPNLVEMVLGWSRF